MSENETTIDLIEEGSMTAAGDGPCWDGYKQVGMKKGKNGKHQEKMIQRNQLERIRNEKLKVMPN